MFFKLKNKWNFSEFAKAVAMLAGGSAAGQALGIVMMPVFTRLYSPEDFGGLAVFSSALGVLVVNASLRFELAIPQAKNHSAAANLVCLCLLIIALLSLFLAFVIAFWGDQLQVLMANKTVEKYLWLLPISFFLVACFNVLNYWQVRCKKFAIITRTKIQQSIGQVTTRLLFGIYQPGVFGLLVAGVVSQTAGLTAYFVLFIKFLRNQKPVISWRKMKLLALRYKKFPKFMVPSSLMNAMSQHTPALLIAALFGAENAGYYLVAQNMLGIPFNLIGISVSQVFHSEAAELYRNKPELLKQTFQNVTKKLFFVGLLPVIFLIFFGEQVFSFFLGENWGKAGKFSEILSFMFLLRFVSSPVSNIIFIIEKQQIALIFQAMLLSTVLISLIVSAKFDASIDEAMSLFSIAMGGCYMVMYLINRYQLKKLML